MEDRGRRALGAGEARVHAVRGSAAVDELVPEVALSRIAVERVVLAPAPDDAELSDGTGRARRVLQVGRDADAHHQVVRAARLHRRAALERVGPLRAVLEHLCQLDRARAGFGGAEGALYVGERAGARVIATLLARALRGERAALLLPVQADTHRPGA